MSEAHALYEFHKNNPTDYLSDFARYVRSPQINGPATAILNHKHAFLNSLAGFPEHVPRTLAVIEDGGLLALDGGCRAATSIVDFLRDDSEIVVKPMGGGGGSGIVFLRAHDGRYFCNGQNTTAEALDAKVRKLKNHLVVELVRQHPATAAPFPETTNTVRLVVLRDTEPFIAIAVQRIGTSRSRPVDNWGQGGLSAHIDLDAGRLGPGVSFPFDGRLEWHERHPETGAQIMGATVPNWHLITSTVLRMTRAAPYLRYVGWDIVPTVEGFKVLEGNNHTDVNLLQVHRPLLADARIRAFYRRHNVIR